MEAEIAEKKHRVFLDFKCQFPEKLYDVANDSYLVFWTRSGTVTVPCEDEFEEKVMELYPGFLQIPSFLNFKRLFREYGFDRDYGPNGNLEWSHPLFVRGRRDLVKQIKTRRKSFRVPSRDSIGTPENVVIPTEKHKRYSVRRRKKPQRLQLGDLPDNIDLGGGGDQIDKNCLLKTPQAIIIEERSPVIPGSAKPMYKSYVQEPRNMGAAVNVNQNANTFSNNFSPNKIMTTYAEKEFNEEEYNQWIAKKRKMEETIVKRENDEDPIKGGEKKPNEFWWMYENKTGGEIVQTVNLSKKQSTGPFGESCTPCGFCKCCSAISNYVHLFGEIPENIQVIDYLEEIAPSQEQANTTATGPANNTSSHVTEIIIQDVPNENEVKDVKCVDLGVQESAAIDLLDTISDEDIKRIKSEIDEREYNDMLKIQNVYSQANNIHEVPNDPTNILKTALETACVTDYMV